MGWYYITSWMYHLIVTRDVDFKIRLTISESKADSVAWKLLIIRLTKFMTKKFMTKIHLPEETLKVLTTFSIDMHDILLKVLICLFSWRRFLSSFCTASKEPENSLPSFVGKLNVFKAINSTFRVHPLLLLSWVLLQYFTKKNPEGRSRILIIYLVWY